MESINNLLQLPCASDVQNDKYYHYDPNTTVWKAVKLLLTFDYEWIGRLDMQLEANEQVLARLAKGANQGTRIQRAQAERRHLEKRRQVLVSGWEKIKSILRPASVKLLALPAEIRDHIYSFLYTRPETIEIQHPDFKGRMIPRDPFHYLNSSIVDPRIASEAATAFYQMNSFSFSTSNSEHVHRFLSTDHYGSGVTPKATLRRIAIVIASGSYYRWGHGEPFDEHEKFEKDLRQSIAFYPSVYKLRSLEVPLLAMPELCVLDVSITKNHTADLRELAPLIKRLRRREVRVRVTFKWGKAIHSSYELYEVPGNVKWDSRYFATSLFGFGESSHPESPSSGGVVETPDPESSPGELFKYADISRLFDDPTDEDRTLVGKRGDQLRIDQDVQKENLGLWFAQGRVIYKDHMDVCEKLDAMEAESRQVLCRIE